MFLFPSAPKKTTNNFVSLKKMFLFYSNIKLTLMEANKLKATRQVWALLAIALFKLGERLVVGVVGSAWSGPRSTDILLRTVYEDCEHGSNMQSSILLMNLHKVVLSEGHLPEEWFIEADNTPKETKNQITLWSPFAYLRNICELAQTSTTPTLERKPDQKLQELANSPNPFAWQFNLARPRPDANNLTPSC